MAFMFAARQLLLCSRSRFIAASKGISATWKLGHQASPNLQRRFADLSRAEDAIRSYGSKGDDGKFSCAYGVLFDKTANTRESAVGG